MRANFPIDKPRLRQREAQISDPSKLTPVQKAIVKGEQGEFAGLLSQYKYTPKAFNSYHPSGLIMSTEKTNRTCRLCRGTGWHKAIYQGHGNMVTNQMCGQCGGTGEVFG